MSSMQPSWVVGVFEGERARSVLDHADAGIGYIILERAGKGRNQTCLAAFRRMMDSPLPPEFTEVKNPTKIAEYESRRLSRAGIRSARPTTVDKLFPGAKYE